MPLITRQLTNVGSPLYTPDGVLIANKTISFLLVNEFGYATSVFDAVTKERIYGTTSAITSAGGEFSVNLWPNDRGDKITYYACTISDTSVDKITSPVPSGVTALSWFDFKLAGTVLTPIEVNALNVHINDHNDPHQVTKTQVGLGNVDNTSDVNKPISTAQANALASKEATTNKDSSGGYAGLTLFKLNMKNVLGTITSFFTNSNTAARTYTLPDTSGAVPVYAQDISGNVTGIVFPNGLVSPLNAFPSNAQYKKARKALANVKSGVGNMKLLVIGDSTSVGFGAVTPSSYTGAKAFCTPTQVAKYLTASGITAKANSFFGCNSFLFTSPTVAGLYDPKISGTSGWSNYASSSLGGGAFRATSAATFTYTPTENTTTFDVYYWDFTGTMSIDIGGTGTTNIIGGGTGAVKKTTITAAASLSPLNIIWISGNCFIQGVVSYNSAVPEVSIMNAAWSGSKVSDWNSSSSAAFNLIAGITLVAPNLTIIRAGINDWNAATSPAAFITDLTNVVVTAQLSGDVIIETSPYGVLTGTPSATLATQQALIDAMQTVALSKNCAFNNNAVRWGSQVEMNALGYYSDSIHYSGIGYSDLATSTFKYLSVL